MLNGFETPGPGSCRGMRQLRIANAPVRRPVSPPEGRCGLRRVAGTRHQEQPDAVSLLLGIIFAKPRIALTLHDGASFAPSLAPASMTKDVVGKLMAKNQSQLVICFGKLSQGRAYEQAAAVGPGMQIIGWIELHVISASPRGG